MRPRGLPGLCLALAFGGTAFAADPAALPPVYRGEARVVIDFFSTFDAAEVSGSTAFSSSDGEESGGRALPGIFLHPGQEPARATYPPESLPALAEGERLLLFGHGGIRDGVPWERQSPPRPGGVIFRIRADGKEVLALPREEPGWGFFSADLSHLAGREVRFALEVDGAGDTNYDWAVFGQPLLCVLGRAVMPIEKHGDGYSLDCARLAPLLIGAEGDGATGPGAWLTVAPDGLRPAARGPATDAARRFAFVSADALPADLHLGSGEVTRLELWSFPARLVLRDLGVACGLPLAGRPTTIHATVENLGYGASAPGTPLEVTAPDGERRLRELPVLEPRETRVIRCGAVTLPERGRLEITAALGESTRRFTVSVMPRGRPLATLSGATSKLAFFGDAQGVRHAAFRRNEPLEDGGAETSWGVIYPLATFAPGVETLEALTFDLENDGGHTLTLIARRGDVTFRETWSVRDDLYRFETRFDSTAPVGFTHFGGPALLWGEGSTGPAHDFAILPGVEYLDAADHSSSLRLASPPLNDHHVPHPLDLTAHCAAISAGDVVLALLWDHGQRWDGRNDRPLAYFDVPPADGDRDYARMQLFVPSTEQGVSENHLQAETVTTSDTVILRGAVLAATRHSPGLPAIAGKPRAGDLVLRCLKKYYELFTGIEPVPEARSWLEEKRLSRVGWLESVYVPGEGTRHCVGERWSPAPTPGVFTLLLFDALDTGGVEGTELLERVEQFTADAIARRGASHLASRINCHIMEGEYPFYAGHLEAALDAWNRDAHRHAGGLTPEGGARWYPGPSARQKKLGAAGQVTGGNTARSAMHLAHHARVTGDPEITVAARRALDHVEAFRVPRGAQGWECPLHCPDILMPAYAVRACVDLYRITADEEYLDRARYWAWSGMPFVYAWGAAGISGMEGNTTPIFGTTYFNHSWIGMPVVWCGLVYAYGLFKLAEVEPGEPTWSRVALAITRSAMAQQYAEPGPSQGCYPDSYSLRLNQRNPADIHPEDIMVNAFTARGLDPGIKTAIVTLAGTRIHVSSGARISRATAEKDRLTIELDFFPRRPVHIFLGQWRGPARIDAGGVSLASVPDLTKVERGWKALERPRGLALKARSGVDGRLAVTVSLAEPGDED